MPLPGLEPATLRLLTTQSTGCANPAHCSQYSKMASCCHAPEKKSWSLRFSLFELGLFVVYTKHPLVRLEVPTNNLLAADCRASHLHSSFA